MTYLLTSRLARLRRASETRALLLALVAGSACVCGRTSPQGQVSIATVDPGFAVAGERTQVRIHGSGFRLELVTTLDGKASLDPFSVRVGALPLTTAVLRDSGLIEATLPNQLSPGVYPVTVSIGSRQAVLEGGVQVLAPIGLALQAPANLASGQGQPFGLSVSSRATTPVRISLESAGLTPAGAAAMSALLLPSALQPEETVAVVGTLTSLRPAQGVNVRLAVAVGWSLGPLSGVVEASAPVVVEARAALSLSLSATPAARVSAGLQRLQLTLTASNTGGAGLTLDAVAAPSLLATGTAAATLATSSAPPGQTVIAGGTSQSFTWQYDVSGSGTLTFTGAASGVEQGSGAALTPPSVISSSVSVQQPALLALSATASPAVVSAGVQQVSVILTVQNPGEADAVLETLPPPAIASTGSASATLTGSPPSAAGTVIKGGASKSFTWTWNTGGSGTLTFSASVTGHDGNSGTALTPPPFPTNAVSVQAAGALSLSASAAPTQVSAGLQRVTLTLTATNSGGAAVRLDALPTPAVRTLGGTAASAIFSSPASPAGTLLNGGASASYSWQYDVSGSGTLSFSAAASGTDANSGNAITPAPVSTAAVTVQRPAGLSLSASVSPATVSAGLQQFQVTLQATNNGEAALVFNALPAPIISASGTAVATLSTSPPSPAGSTLAGGASRSFSWTYSASGSGTISFTASASGTDANAASVTLAPPPASAGQVLVQQPAALSIASIVASPSTVVVGQAIDVAVTVNNTGEAAATQVQLAGLSASPTATQGTAPAPAGIAGGGSYVFHVPYTGAFAGTFAASSGTTGTDGNAGNPLSAPIATSAPITITASQVAITFPGAGATLAPGASLTAVASASASSGGIVTQLSLAASGAGTVGSASVPAPKQTVGAFDVLANLGATTGQTITLQATAIIGGATFLSQTVTITIGSPTVTQLVCQPQQGLSVGSGQTELARVEATMSDGSFSDQTQAATWTSDTPAVATVASGVVKGIAAGNATVTAAVSGFSASCLVQVRPAAPFYQLQPVDPFLLAIPVPSNPNGIGPGGTLTLKFVRFDSTSSQPVDLTASANWTTDTPGVATVKAGLVTGVAAGISKITACIATTNCGSTLAVVGSSLDTGSLSGSRFAIGSAQTFDSLRLRAGTTTYLLTKTANLQLTVNSFRLEAGALLVGDADPTPDAVNDSSITRTAEGGAAGSSGGGGGAGAGNGSNFCTGTSPGNCGGDGRPPGANACTGSSCPGGAGAQGPRGGSGAIAASLNSPGDAGAGGGDGGNGGRGGSITTGTYASAGGTLGHLDGFFGGNGGGGGNSDGVGGPGAGGGGGGGAIYFVGRDSASVRIDGTVSLNGGSAGWVRSGTGGPGGAGAGGSFWVSASTGQVTGTGTIFVRGGNGGSGNGRSGAGTSACGGGGGGGGGSIALTAPVAGPQLVTRVEGGAGGKACSGGGQRGEDGALGQLAPP